MFCLSLLGYLHTIQYFSLCVRIQSHKKDPKVSLSVCVCVYLYTVYARVCVCRMLQRNRQIFQEAGGFLKTATKGFIFLCEHQNTCASSCGQTCIIYEHTCRYEGSVHSWATLQTTRYEICILNHLGFQQLSSDERAKPWAEISCSPHSHPQVGEIIGTVFFFFLPVFAYKYIFAWMHGLFIFSTGVRIILPVLNSSFFTYLHKWFLLLISGIKEVAHSKCCRGLWIISMLLSPVLQRKT